MSKYDKLWDYVEDQEGNELMLTFDEIGVGKISMKQQTVRFKRLAE